MCGRYYLYIKLEKLLNKYGIKDTEINYTPKKEVFPSEKSPIIINSDNKNYQLKLFKWGFSPSFTNNLIINARSETIEKKSIFKNSFLKRRCLIPATGFFEWKSTGSGKEKYKIYLKNSSVFSFAGIFDYFEDNNGNQIPAYTILTTSANSKIRPIHNRMPVILNSDREKDWLDHNIKNICYLKNLLKPITNSRIKIKEENNKN